MSADITREVYEALLEYDVRLKSSWQQHEQTPPNFGIVSHAYPISERGRNFLKNRLHTFILPNGSYEIWGTIEVVRDYLWQNNLTACIELNE